MGGTSHRGTSVYSADLDQDLRSVTSDLADRIRRRLPESMTSVLQTLTLSAVDSVPGARYAGITVITKGDQVTSMAATAPPAELIDRLQGEFGEGPCVDAARQNHTVRVDDLPTDTRWPSFTAAAVAQTPINSILSFQLYTDREATGSLNLFSDDASAFTDGAEEIGLVHATHVAVALYAARRHDEFESALASRDVIGQAKGMIMERYDLDAMQAFDLLKRLSQDSNTRLADVAKKLVSRDHLAAAPTPKGQSRSDFR